MEFNSAFKGLKLLKTPRERVFKQFKWHLPSSMCYIGKQNPPQTPTWYPQCHGMLTSGTTWRLLNGCPYCLHIFLRANGLPGDFPFSVDPVARRLEIHSKIVFRYDTDAFRRNAKLVRNALCVAITERLFS